MEIEILVFVAIILAYGLLSRRLELSSITPQMVFVAMGMFLGAGTFGLIDLRVENEVFLLVGEAALALTLFTDATRIDIASLRENESLPTRLLSMGMPLTIAAGTAIAALMFTDLTLFEAAIIGTVLSPTDAGLGQALVNNPHVPTRIRQALNVESGLNDGIATPILFMFIALAEAEENTAGGGFWVSYALKELGLGALVGLAVGIIGGWLVGQAIHRKLMTRTFQWLTFPALALIAWLLAALVEGNGFIAAFTAGLAIAWVTGSLIKEQLKESVVTFSETGGQLLDFIVFFIFGAIVVNELGLLDWRTVLYAGLSLTVIRMLPVALSLIGSRLHRGTILFMGWFGPRGLASIVLGTIVLQESPALAGLERIQDVVMVTVVMSVFAHGISTTPFVKLYLSRIAGLDAKAPERKKVKQHPTRTIATPNLRNHPSG
ncbi:K(+)/H(+) antiporter NhaP2 [bacterium BMS3Abin01]|nr:K(+)/H(+) antiporter NhaP2 [bacterium BMS3Abin01]